MPDCKTFLVSAFFKNFLKNFWFKFFLIFSGANLLLRLYFIFIERQEFSFSAIEVIKILSEIFFIGLFFDALTLAYLAFIPILYYNLVTNKFFNNSKHLIFVKICYFIFLNILVFAFFAEIIFYDEFQARFNFIAVDYLIYTTEVIGNIFESYPMSAIIGGIIALSLIIFMLTNKKFIVIKTQNFSTRIGNLAIYLAIIVSASFTVDSNKIDHLFSNNHHKEIAWNGIYQFFSAFRNNEINYEKFYTTIDQQNATDQLRQLISKQEGFNDFINNDDIARNIKAKGSEKKYNIIIVVMESFSADFMKSFGNKDNLSENLDQLAKKGLLFSNLKATGTRTVRGLEAITLSIPPTPGNSIVRRPNNDNLFNIATPLIARGYQAKFIYGGDGYFDNMNNFFKKNGYQIVDRSQFKKNEISFNNVWGVADEDLYDKVIKEADESFAKNKNFIDLVLTTSNHRPFTYPDNKIDIPSKTNRNGAVKYADYAIGQFIKKAQSKSWFDKTIFVFIADHCAGSAGNIEVPIWRYQIPAIIYAPKIVPAQIYAKNASQIDIAPTVLGLLNLSYQSKFFGIDLLKNNKISLENQKLRQRVFISTYTDLGYVENDQLYLLKPKKEQEFFKFTLKKFGYDGSVEEPIEKFDQEILNRQIQYYQLASFYFKNDKLKNFLPKESK
ncbi:MAG: LTA synthase family protein [Alphaproteobacteria bacterium]